MEITNEHQGTSEEGRPFVTVTVVTEFGNIKVPWVLNHALTDRWGEINTHRQSKALTDLLANGPLLEQLRARMWDEMTFVACKDGVYGILFESEYESIETDTDHYADMPKKQAMLKPLAEVVEILCRELVKLQVKFPGVDFCIADPQESYGGRPTIWAFVPLTLSFSEKQAEDLGTDLIAI